MAAGQLSPFPSCASGLGFLNSSDCRSAASLLTPAASICTVSSLSHAAGDISDSGYSRVRTKTMQTKEILKSPQPHRFHLVPTTGRRRTPSGPGIASRPSAQLRDAWATDAPTTSPGNFEHDGNIAERDGKDLFFPLGDPLMPPAETDNPQAPYSPQSPCAQTDSAYINEHEQLSPYTIQSPAFSNTSRPTSTGSALSILTASASLTMVHDRGSERASCSFVEKEMFDAQYRKASLVDERPSTAVFTLPEEPDSLSSYADHHKLSAQTMEAHVAIDMAVVESPLADALSPIILPDTSTNGVGEQADTSHTTSTSLDSLISEYRPTSNYIDDDILLTADTAVAHSIDLAPLPTLVSNPLPHPIPAIKSTSASPTKPPAPARDRRKFALRRQAIYAEYGFQIALPDSDSDSSVKFLASSPGTKGRAGQGRTASAYVKFPASHSGRSHSALSASASRASSADDYFHHDHVPHGSETGEDDEDEMQLFRSAHFNDVDRFGRFSVQDSILGATRIPRLDDFADVTTSTPPRPARSRVAGHHSLGTGLGLGLGSSPGSNTDAGSGCNLNLDPDCSISLDLGSSSGLGSGSGVHLSVATSSIWQPGHPAPYVPSAAPQPLRPTPSQKPRARESTCLPVSASERSARLSAWDFDPGHHPIVQDLLDEVDRALEQWGWIMKLRSYI
ncbi:hypothetical protein C2E23DRAFT_884948 [Lenzites betulinus]|nr:hypothetical protein C2E23DRAFT_884948 [Lenzites betulinus]